MMLIVDSEASHAFASLGGCFGRALVVIMSAVVAPSRRGDDGGAVDRGRLLTLFLHSPLTGLCRLCGREEASVDVWRRAHAMAHEILRAIADRVMEEREEIGEWKFFHTTFMSCRADTFASG